MKNKELFKEIDGVFKAPSKNYYFGKLTYGSPYFYPTKFVSTIISIRKLKSRTIEEIEKKNSVYEHLKNAPINLYSNYPMVRRAKNKIVKIFGNDYYITWGWPISVKTVELGWKDKFESPRFEWAPQFAIFFFNLQFCIWWNAPKLEGQKYTDNNVYYEMILWYINYCDKNIKKAEKEWKWVDGNTKESTWNKNYLK